MNNDSTTIITPVTMVPVTSLIVGDIVVYQTKTYAVQELSLGTYQVHVQMEDNSPERSSYDAWANTVSIAFQFQDQVRVLYHQAERPTSQET